MCQISVAMLLSINKFRIKLLNENTNLEIIIIKIDVVLLKCGCLYGIFVVTPEICQKMLKLYFCYTVKIIIIIIICRLKLFFLINFLFCFLLNLQNIFGIYF